MDKGGEARANRRGQVTRERSKWDELRDVKNDFFDRVSGREAERREIEAEAFDASERCRELREIGVEFGERMREMQFRGTGATMAELLERVVERNDIERPPNRLITCHAFWSDLEMLDQVNAGMIKERDVAALTGGMVDPREMKLAFREVRRFADEARREAGLKKPMPPSMSKYEVKRLVKRIRESDDKFVDSDTAWRGAGYVYGDELVARENLLATLNLEKLCRVGGGFTDAYEAAANESREKAFGTDPKKEMVKKLRAQLRELDGENYANLEVSFEALADNHPSPFIDDLLSVDIPGTRQKRYLGLDALTERKLNGQPLLSDEQVLNVMQWYNHAVAAERAELQEECIELEDDYVEGIDVAVARGLLPRKFRSAADVFRKGARGRSPSVYHLSDSSNSERDSSWVGWTFLGPDRDKVDIFLDMRLAFDGRPSRFADEDGSGEFRKEVLMHEMTHNIARQAIFPDKAAETIINEAMTEHIATIVLEAGEEHRYGGGDFWMGRDLWEGATGRRWAAENMGYARASSDETRRRKKDVSREPAPYRFGSGTTYPSERETLRFLQSQGRREIPIEMFYDAYVGDEGDGSRERLLHAIQRSFPELRSLEEIEDFIVDKNEEIRRRNTPLVGRIIESGLRAFGR